MRIPEAKIEEIRLAADIVDTISEYVELRKRGKNFIGLCPFHNEKTPSFTVSEEKQIFHCFGCHAGGNVFKFIMEYEKISFIESVQELANKLGITLEYDESASTERQSEQEILYDINTEAARYFSDNLLNREEGEIARSYFKNRNIKLPTQRSFGLGYALPGWENFLNFAQTKKINMDKALELGLVGQSSDGRLYDKFSGRIIFPIFSPNGRVIAFAGRILENREGKAKYLNSPESLIYVKGKTLYGLSHAKDEIRKLGKAILVEGYMDLISLYQSGVKNVVAVSGTALTDEQVQLLSRYTKNVVLLFDADTAGIKASMRSIEILLRRDMEIKIASVPEGEDPDSYVQKFGKEKFEELIKQAKNFLEYQSGIYESQGMFDDPAKATEAIRELVKPVALINDSLKRNLLIKSIAKKFNLREKLLETELEKFTAQLGRQSVNEARIKDREEAKKSPQIQGSSAQTSSAQVYNLEREIIKLLFEGDKSIIEIIFENIEHDLFSIPVHRELAELVYNTLQNNGDLIASSMIEKVKDQQAQDYIIELTFDKYSISKNWDNLHPGLPDEKVLMQTAKDTIRKFKLERLRHEIDKNQKKLEQAENEIEQFELMKQIRLQQTERSQIMHEE